MNSDKLNSTSSWISNEMYTTVSDGLFESILTTFSKTPLNDISELHFVDFTKTYDDDDMSDGD